MRFCCLIIGSVVVVGLSGPGVRVALAQAPQRVDRLVHVEQPGALVRVHPNLKAEVLAAAPVDTVLVVLDRESGWLWVLLPPDAHGTKRPGWIPASYVAKSPIPDLDPTNTTAPPPKPPKPVAEFGLVKPVASLKLVKPEIPVIEDTRHLDKARRDLEKARQDYEKLMLATQATQANAPAPPPTPQ